MELINSNQSFLRYKCLYNNLQLGSCLTKLYLSPLVNNCARMLQTRLKSALNGNRVSVAAIVKRLCGFNS